MWTTVAVAALSLLAGGHYLGGFQLPFLSHSPATDALDVERWSCRPFLPNLFEDAPPSQTLPVIRRGISEVDKFFQNRFSKGDIDSLSVAVVTSSDILYEKNFGVIRGNETETSPPTDSHSSYRIASVSKLFTALEGFILESKGVIAWDDPVEKYLPGFKYRLDGLDPTKPAPSHHDVPMTMYQLLTHTSGLGRDWPPGTVSRWPHDMAGGGPPPTNGNPFPSHQSLFDAIALHHLTSPPATYPAYSNTGVGLLGVALSAASSAASSITPAMSYAELLQHDLFGPMGMNGSHFLTTARNEHHIVVPSVGPEVADQDFLDAMNPAGGQFSSLSDMMIVTQTLLNARHPKSQISPYMLSKWLHTVHAFEEDDWTEIGLMWEIIKARDSNGRLRKIYWKLGAMAGYHTAIAIHPGTGYGVVVLMGGRYPDAAKLAYDIFEIMQPAIDKALSDAATELYSGTWVGAGDASDGETTATIVVERGTLYVERMTLLGVDILKRFGAPGRLALRSSMRRDEFRIDTGIPGYNGMQHMGCYPYWNGQDLWGIRDNAAINAIYFSGSGSQRKMHVPSLSLVLQRK